MDNQQKRVTECIYDRFCGMYDTDIHDGNEQARHNFAHNCALALDLIGANKVKEGEAYDFILRCLNNEFKDEKETLTYFETIRAPRKAKEWTANTVAKRQIKKLLASGVPMTSKVIAGLVGVDENFVNDVIKESASK